MAKKVEVQALAVKRQTSSVRGDAIASEATVIRHTNPQEVFWNRILFALVLVWTFLALCFPMFDTDFWWHLKTGEWILAGNGIPYVDLYTFRDSDKPWIDLHWGFQVLITVLYHAGGIPLVTLTKAAVITGAVAIAWRAGGSQLSTWKKALLWILPIVCVVGRGNERPEMLSQLFLTIWLLIARQTDSRPNLIWYLPLLQLVWVNCHALFVLGLVVGFCYGVDAITREIGQGRFGLQPRIAGPNLRTIFFAAGFVALACFVNPYFEEGAFFPLTLFRKFSVEREFYRQNIGEFRSPIDYLLSFGLTNIYLAAELAVWFVTAFSFFWLLASKRRWSPFRLLLFAGFSHLAWQMSRNTNIFALVSGFIACENFADSAFSSVETARPGPNSETRPTKWLSVLVFGLCLMVVTGWWNEIGEKNKPFTLGEAPRWFIHDAAKFAGQPGFPDFAFVSNIGQAEVYVYHNGPKRRVFMDARLEVCTQRTFELYNNVLADMASGSTRWQSLFAGGELPVVILDSRTSRMAISGLLNTPSWRLVFADSAGAVFLPTSKANQLKLPVADPTPLMYPDGPPKK
jgi:hypothetical protein